MNTDVLAKLSSEIFAEKQGFSPMAAAKGAKGIAGSIASGLGWLGSRAVTRPVMAATETRAPGMIARMFGQTTPNIIEHAAGRTLSAPRVAATGLAGSMLGGHMFNNAATTEGTSLNPVTWANPQSRQGVFDNAMEQFKGQQRQGNQELDQSYLEHNNPSIGNAFWRMTRGTPEQLHQQMSDQSYTGNSWFNPSLGGLNPLANRSMAANTNQARGIQSRDESGLERMRSRLATRGSSMNPQVRSSMDQEISAMQQRINTRIPQAGGGSSGGGGGNGAPTGNWANHMQPTPQQLSYFLNPNDYRNSPAPTTRIPWEQYASSSPLNIS